MADIVIINPRFDTSFWGLEHCMSLLGKRANLPVACLALLAALVPDHHCVTLIDENVEEIDFDRLARADLVCLTGMSIQGRRMCEILKEVRSRGVMTVETGEGAWVVPPHRAVWIPAGVLFGVRMSGRVTVRTLRSKGAM